MKTHNAVSPGVAVCSDVKNVGYPCLFERTMTQYVLWMGGTLYKVRSVPFESIYRYKLPSRASLFTLLSDSRDNFSHFYSDLRILKSPLMVYPSNFGLKLII